LSLLALFGAALVMGAAWAILRGEYRLFEFTFERVVKLVWDGRILVLAYLPGLVLFGWLCATLPGLDRTMFRACVSAAILAVPVFVTLFVEGSDHRGGLIFFASATYIAAWLCLVGPRLVIPMMNPGRFAHPVSNMSL
jgi:hypothetical protein